MSLRDITIGDLIPPPGQPTTRAESRTYALNRIQEFLDRGVITEDEAEALRKVWK